MDQIESEIDGVLDFLQRIYGLFDFDFQLRLSTRPERFLGDAAVWDHAEQARVRPGVACVAHGPGVSWVTVPATGQVSDAVRPAVEIESRRRRILRPED